MSFFLYNYNIYLASKSPRRREYLTNLKISYTIVDAEIDESSFENEIPINYVSRVVNKKAEEALKYISDEKGLVISADTTVIINDLILQKPKNDIEAKEFLNLLSNKWHTVITGYKFKSKDNKINHFNFLKTDVLFKKLTNDEIDFYISTKEYVDRAGGYAIQGIASFMVEKINGSHSNVIGFPIKEIFEDLQNLNIIQINL